MLALGSGDPAHAICSTLIAEVFQSVRYPIIPLTEPRDETGARSDYGKSDVLHIRHSSLLTPRDFDISPYFRVIKPTVENGFDHSLLTWADQLENK